MAKRWVCKSEDLISEGNGIRFLLPELGERITGFLVRYSGKAYAYVNQCAHIPVELDWNEGDFSIRHMNISFVRPMAHIMNLTLDYAS